MFSSIIKQFRKVIATSLHKIISYVPKVFGKWPAQSVAFFLLILALLYFLAVVDPQQFTPEYAPNIITELISIAITVLVIDYLNDLKLRTQLKERLIRDLGSKSNDFALRAVEELRFYGWLDDNSLIGAYLFEANLKGAKLFGANLEVAELLDANLSYAELFRVNLKGARMIGTNLEGADLYGAILMDCDLRSANLRYVQNLTEDQLRSCRNLSGAIMPDGTKLQGPMNLQGVTLEIWLASYYGKKT